MVLHVKDGKKFFNDELLSHIRNRNHENVLTILENVKVKNLVDSSGMTLLHIAACVDHGKTVKYLIERGCKVDALDNCGNTPLMLAVIRGHENIIESLLEAKANVFTCNQDKQTPMSVALAPQLVCYPRIIYKFFGILKKECSADSRRMAIMLIDVKCPFPRAMYFEDALITEYMLDNGCTVYDRDPENGFTALHYAVKFHDINNVKLLLERGADINAEDKSQRMPLHHYESPILNRNYEILIILLENGALLDIHSKHSYNLEGYVLQYGDINEVKALLKFNIDFNARNTKGTSLLSFFVRNRNSGVMELLQGKEFDVKPMDNRQRTALWYAIRALNLPAVIFLLNKGANPNNVFDALSNGVLRFTNPKEYFSHNQSRIKCLDLLLQFGADVLSEDLNRRTIFDIAMEDDNVSLLNPVLEYVAMKIALGHQVNESILVKIQSHTTVVKYFNECQKTMKAMQATLVRKPHVMLFDLLIASKEQLLNYTQNEETVEKLQCVMYKMRDLNFRFIKNLRNCIEYIIRISKLRKQAALRISKIVKLQCNWDIIYKIVMLLDEKALENVGQI